MARVAIGKVRGAHGIQGELKVETFDPGSRTLQKGLQIWLGTDEAPHRIVGVRPMPKGILVRVEGIADRDAAQALLGKEIAIEKSGLPKLRQDEYYLDEIIGFAVKTTAGEVVGVVEGSLAGGAHEILLVRGAAPRNEKEILIPAVEGIVVSVDKHAREVVIDPPEGLLDL